MKKHILGFLGAWATLLTLMPAALCAQTELLSGGGFENAASGFTASSGVNYFANWRWFAVAGSLASVEVVSDAHSGSRAVSLTRQNTTGDTALDRDDPTLRVPIQGGGRYLTTVWAKSTSGSRLILRMPLYNSSGSYLGVENQTVHQLSSGWTQFTALMTATSSAAFCNVALRLDGAGEMIVDDLSLVRIEDSAPTVVLPVGVSTDLQPRIEWRGTPSSAYEIVVTDEESPTSGVIWTSGQVSSSAFSATPPPLPTGQTLYTFVRVQSASGWTDWSPRRAPFRIEPLPQPADVLHTFSLGYTRSLTASEAFQHAHLVAALQGIVNRDGPRLFVDFNTGYSRNVDSHWLARLRQPGRWLSSMTLAPAADISALVSEFRSSINGVVVWDPQVNATSNLASTIAGADGLLPVVRDLTPGSLYMQLVNGPAALPVVVDLVGKFTGSGTIPDTARASTGSRKCDAYIWALELYLKTGRVDPAYMGYYLDAYWIGDPTPGQDWQNHTLTNHDYFIARKGFFWDLHVWSDEKPVDDPSQALGTDLNTLKEILAAAAAATGGQKMIHVGGFTPWAFKYTSEPGAGGSHGAVVTEWETVRILSAYNAYIDADALGLGAMANASLYSHLPLPRRYAQTLPPMPEELRARGVLDPQGNIVPKTYLLHYAGDYDSAAWLNTGMPQHWDNAGRGNTVIPWAVNPNLSDRAPHVFEYLYRTRTASDSFMAGDSGAGYVNPTQLLPPRSPSGLASGAGLWIRHCRDYYSRFGITFTGFIINGLSGTVTAAAETLYSSFSNNGIVLQGGTNHAPLHREGQMPSFVMSADISANVSASTALVGSQVAAGTLQFLVYRSVLVSAGYYATINSALKSARPEAAYVFCDPMTFSYMARKSLGGLNERLASSLFDTFPAEAQTGQNYTAQVALRNDGWETWPGGGAGAYKVLVELTPNGEFQTPAQIALPRPVPAGDSIVLELPWSAAPSPGNYLLRYEPADAAGIAFSTTGNAPALVPITVSGPMSGIDDYALY